MLWLDRNWTYHPYGRLRRSRKGQVIFVARTPQLTAADDIKPVIQQKSSRKDIPDDVDKGWTEARQVTSNKRTYWT